MKSIQLSIPTPCDENWDNMSSNEKGRYCSRCSTTVLDLSTTEDAALYTLLAKEKKQICARLPNAKLNVPLYQNRSSMSSTLQLKAVILGAALLTSIPAWSAELPSETHQISLIQRISDNAPMTAKIDKAIRKKVEFFLTDQVTGDSLAFAKIKIMAADSSIINGGYTNFEGKATIYLLEEEYDLIDWFEISCQGFETITISWSECSKENETKIELTPIEEIYYKIGMIKIEQPELIRRESIKQKTIRQ